MKLFKTIKNIFAIEELRTRILNTIGFIIIYRLGSFIVLPGLNYRVMAETTTQPEGLLGFLDTFVGGAFANKAIFGLGIMPYISASIVVQLMQVAIPYFQRLQKDGESGRKRITQITRFLTIVICLAQTIPFLTTIDPKWIIAEMDPTLFRITAIIVLTSGTIFCMWLGEKITEKGIGNGISLLIMIGIISRLPLAVVQNVTTKGWNVLPIVLEIIALFFVVMVVVLLTQATRRIPVNYAKQVVGNKVYGGQRQFIPLKVNAAGVMPIIFAQSLMFVPSLIAGLWEGSETAAYIKTNLGNQWTWQYNALFAFMIIIFTYFYTAITVNPNQIADDLKRNGGFIPGIKPGPQTAEFIDNVISKITLPGALFIAAVAILPAFAKAGGVSEGFANFYGGTSLLIMVGVVLDTLQQIESYLLMKRYEGLMKNGKEKGRTRNMAAAASVS